MKTEDEACGGALHYYPFSKGAAHGSRVFRLQLRSCSLVPDPDLLCPPIRGCFGTTREKGEHEPTVHPGEVFGQPGAELGSLGGSFVVRLRGAQPCLSSLGLEETHGQPGLKSVVPSGSLRAPWQNHRGAAGRVGGLFFPALLGPPSSRCGRNQAPCCSEGKGGVTLAGHISGSRGCSCLPRRPLGRAP